MGIFGNILGRIFGHKSKKAPAPAPTPQAQPAPTPQQIQMSRCFGNSAQRWRSCDSGMFTAFGT